MVHHRRGLRRLGLSDDLLDRVERDFQSAGLDPRQVAILRYAARLTTAPATVAASDVEALRAAGLSSTDVLHVAEVTAYYAYANRIADGLGVALEETTPEGGDGE